MIASRGQWVVAIFLGSSMFLSLASAQTERGRRDPIAGFAESYPGQSSTQSASSGGGSSSFWSSYQGRHTPTPGYSENPATIGAIVSSSQGRYCGGMFRMTRC